jgi:glucose-6-phosphate isomerase
MSPRDLWARYRKLCCVCDSMGITLEVSRMKFPDDFLQRMARGARG